MIKLMMVYAMRLLCVVMVAKPYVPHNIISIIKYIHIYGWCVLVYIVQWNEGKWFFRSMV